MDAEHRQEIVLENIDSFPYTQIAYNSIVLFYYTESAFQKKPLGAYEGTYASTQTCAHATTPISILASIST